MSAPVTRLKPKPQEATVVPVKIGLFGGQGSGKSTSAALIALALSVQYHNRAPVVVTDTEAGWQFLRRLFKIEGVEMIQRTTPTFKAMLDDIRFAEKEGASVYVVDQLTIIWQELMQSFKAKNRGFIPINVWGDIKQMWGDYRTAFLNSHLHCLALGRLGNVMDEIEDDSKPGETKLVKTGTQFKAGGGESFGYEPNLLLELSLERKAKVRAGSKREGEGRMIHRVDVLKDRTWALNGRVLRWSDKPSYDKGGFKTVWDSLKSHFDLVQETGEAVRIEEGQSTTTLISDNGQSDWYERRQRRDITAAEVSAVMEMLWPGTGKNEKQMRLKATERIFGFRTKEAAEKAELSVLERGLKILQAFKGRCEKSPDILLNEEDYILESLGKDIAAYDAGEAEDETLPF